MRGRVIYQEVHAFNSSALLLRLPTTLHFTHLILRLCYLGLEYAAILILIAFGISCGRERQPIRLSLFRSLLSMIADNLCINNSYLNDLLFLRISTLAPDTIYLCLEL